MRFGHVAIRVKDIDKILRFYCAGLGLQEAFRINNEDGSLRIVYLHISNGQYLELCLGGKVRGKFNDQKSLGVRHICFTVDNLEQFKKGAEGRGVIFDSGILSTQDKNRFAYLFDPEGNKLEVTQITPDSPHHAYEKSLKKLL